MPVKTAVFCLVLAAALVSCERYRWEDTVVVNETEREIRFKFRHTEAMTLGPGERVSFASEAFQTLEWFGYDYGDDGIAVRHYSPRPEAGEVWFRYAGDYRGGAFGTFFYPDGNGE